jgi:8-oxo-dGTP diphosphatase
MAAYEVECALRLKRDGVSVIGPEGAEVLRSIAEGRSLARTAQALGLSLKKVRSLIAEMERAQGSELVRRRSGSKGGLTEEGAKLLDAYDNHSRAAKEQIERRFSNPVLTVDGILSLQQGIVLVRRGQEPGRGMLALPGGIVEYGETVESAISREFLEETGLRTEVVRLLGVYSNPERDPRGHFISLLFELNQVGGRLRSGDDAAEALVVPMAEIGALAFDHGTMIRDFLQRKEADEERGGRPVPRRKNP